jgi:hypothetical protein
MKLVSSLTMPAENRPESQPIPQLAKLLTSAAGQAISASMLEADDKAGAPGKGDGTVKAEAGAVGASMRLAQLTPFDRGIGQL